jgi:hypothetical protein
MARMKKLAMVLLLVVVGGVTWRARRSDAPDASLLFHRFWIDHEPRDWHERFQALMVDGEHPFGHFATRTVWTGQWEGFHYHMVPRKPGTLDLIFPNTREQQRVSYSARPCAENGFDFCLEISGASRGVGRYYSKKEWVIPDGDTATADAILRNLAHESNDFPSEPR